jgi:homoserine dehydrogenase
MSEGEALYDEDRCARADELIILKFGSSVLRTRSELPNAVHEIYRWYRRGYKVIAVVSAIGLTTDELLCEAREVAGTRPDTGVCTRDSLEPYALAELLATGERASAALLGIALDRAGVLARVLNPGEIGLTAAGPPLDSELLAVNVDRVRELLKGGAAPATRTQCRV